MRFSEPHFTQDNCPSLSQIGSGNACFSAIFSLFMVVPVVATHLYQNFCLFVNQDKKGNLCNSRWKLNDGALESIRTPDP